MCVPMHGKLKYRRSAGNVKPLSIPQLVCEVKVVMFS